MKLDPRQVTGFLRDPESHRLALFYGEDEGLIRERAQALAQRVAGSLNDPFLVSELTRDGWGRIPAEMTALSMIGGRRVVLVRDATDAVLPHVAEAMRSPGTAMLIVEAPDLPKGKLRAFAEAAKDGVAAPCYAEEGKAAAGTIRSIFTDMGVTSDDDAIDWLCENLEPGRSLVRGQAEKLALFAGAKGRVTVDMACACVGSPSAGEADDGLLAALLGRLPEADRAIEAALADGLGGIGLIRTALSLLQRLHVAKLRVDAGASASDAVRGMRPPVFYKTVPAMTAALGRWPADALLGCIEEARHVEMECKQTGSRPELLVSHFVADLARAAQRQRART